MEEWYSIKNIGDVDSPALIVYPDRVKQNIALAKAMVGNPLRLRPHVKTHKTKEATLLMMEAGISKFKCATIAEAEMLSMLNVRDLLLSYQPVGPKIQRLISLIKNYPVTKFSCLVDNSISALQISEQAVSGGVNIAVYIDINAGMNRTGILPGRDAIELYKFCSLLPAIEVAGLHEYDGHICDEDINTRGKRCDEAFAEVERIRNELIYEGYDEPTIVAGGSPTFPVHAKREKVECSPGTFVYWDGGYSQKCSDLTFISAALVITRIISKPYEGIICTDLGHKSIAAENSLTNRVKFLNAPDLEFISQSEEHLVLKAGNDHSYKIGDVLYGMPFHICPTSALYERALVAKGGIVSDEWKIIARNRRIVL